MRDSEKHETQYGYYTIGEYDAREETDDLGRKNYEYGEQQRLRDNIKNGLFSFASILPRKRVSRGKLAMAVTKCTRHCMTIFVK